MAEFLYKQIVNYLNYLIDENMNKDNYVLPSEKQLGQKFNASRVSVRKAFEVLKEQKRIIPIKGKGCIINKHKPYENNYAKKTTFALLMTTIASKHYRLILNGVNSYCNENDIDLITYFTYNDAVLEQNKLISATNNHCDGILLLPTDNDIYSHELLKIQTNETPLILIDRMLKGLNFKCVSSDHFSLAYEAVRLFHNKGIRDVVYISHQEHLSASTKSRTRGVEKGLLDFMGTLNKQNLIYEPVAENLRYRFYLNYFREHPQINGIIFTCSPMLIYLIKALDTLHRKIGSDIHIILIDDEFDYATILDKQQIPSIVQNSFEIGRKSAELLNGIVCGRKTENKQDIYIPVEYKNWN